MGLDISAYKKLTPLDAVFDQYGDPINPNTREPLEVEYYQPVANPHYDRADGLADGVYTYEAATSFRAGSYGGYNRWREQLAELGGWPLGSYRQYEKEQPSFCATAWNAESGPFWELIHFSDCEGTIGAKTSAKLSKDFADYQEKADAHKDEQFRELYSEWRNAFAIAAQDGAVSFH